MDDTAALSVALPAWGQFRAATLSFAFCVRLKQVGGIPPPRDAPYNAVWLSYQSTSTFKLTFPCPPTRHISSKTWRAAARHECQGACGHVVVMC